MYFLKKLYDIFFEETKPKPLLSIIDYHRYGEMRRNISIEQNGQIDFTFKNLLGNVNYKLPPDENIAKQTYDLIKKYNLYEITSKDHSKDNLYYCSYAIITINTDMGDKIIIRCNDEYTSKDLLNDTLINFVSELLDLIDSAKLKHT
jgi:hypothetical protein